MTRNRPAPPVPHDNSDGGAPIDPALALANTTAIENVTVRLQQLQVRPALTSQLTAWHKRCREIGAEQGATIEACKKDIIQAVIDYFDEAYGNNETRLESWQQLCRDIEIEEGTSINKCKKNLEGTYVNIVAFVVAKKRGQPVHKFTSAKALANYIRNKPGKKFPKQEAKKNVVLKWMLVRVYHAPLA